jgi:hypothetical protein
VPYGNAYSMSHDGMCRALGLGTWDHSILLVGTNFGPYEAFYIGAIMAHTGGSALLVGDEAFRQEERHEAKGKSRRGRLAGAVALY